MLVPKTEVIITVGEAELARQVVEPGDYVIGREKDCAIFVDADLVSRHHARLTVNYDEWLIEDIGSANGTFVNDRPVSGSARIFSSQRIKVGSAVIELRRARELEDADASLPPAVADVRQLLPPDLLQHRKYAIGGVVAQGGMGAILDTRDKAIRRNVAMKVMLGTGASHDDLLRFIEEAQITGQLEHPNIVPIHELGVDEQDQPFYTMKMVRGITLKKILELIAKEVPETVAVYPLRRLVQMLLRVCDAMAFAHSKGVIHRDLKPENIMTGDFGEVLVMDWGLAKVLGKKEEPRQPGARSVVLSVKRDDAASATLAGTIMGTPHFMAPEQANGEIEKLDARTDVYALGAILYQILTLQTPVRGETVEEILDKVRRHEIATPTSFNSPPAKYPDGKIPLPHCPGRRIPPALSAIAMKALSLAPGDRYAGASEFKADLDAWLGGFATKAEKAGVATQLWLLVMRNKGIFATVLAAWLFIMALGVGFVVKVTHERNRATALLAELQAGAPAFYQQAKAMLAEGKFDAALDRIAYAISLQPRDAAFHVLNGDLLESQFRFEEARDAYAKALSLDPKNTDTADNLELCEKFIARFGGAKEMDAVSFCDLLAQMLGQERTVEAASLRAAQAIEKRGWSRTPDFSLVKGWNGLLRERGVQTRKMNPAPNGFTIDELSAGLTDLAQLRGIPIMLLDISDTPVSDLSPLKRLGIKNLDRLYLSRTKVSDLSPLSGMKLRFVIFRETPVSDLSPLAGMPLLEEIWAGGTRVRDLAPVAKCKKLKILELSGTPVEDLTPLRHANMSILQLDGCANVHDLTPLAKCPNLGQLILPEQCRDIEFLRNKLKLARLSYRRGPAGVVAQTVAEFWAEYDAPQAPLSEADKRAAEGQARWAGNLAQVRAALPALGFLATEGTTIVKPWGVLLSLKEQNVADVTPLRSLPIDALSLAKTKVTTLSPLRGMKLKLLSLDGTAIKDVSPLLDLSELEAAMVPKYATNLEVLRAHPKLKYLGWEGDWDTPNLRPKLTTAEFWARWDREQAARSK